MLHSVHRLPSPRSAVGWHQIRLVKRSYYRSARQLRRPSRSVYRHSNMEARDRDRPTKNLQATHGNGREVVDDLHCCLDVDTSILPPDLVPSYQRRLGHEIRHHDDPLRPLIKPRNDNRRLPDAEARLLHALDARERDHHAHRSWHALDIQTHDKPPLLDRLPSPLRPRRWHRLAAGQRRGPDRPATPGRANRHRAPVFLPVAQWRDLRVCREQHLPQPALQRPADGRGR